jgi:hypothetical protein
VPAQLLVGAGGAAQGVLVEGDQRGQRGHEHLRAGRPEPTGRRRTGRRRRAARCVAEQPPERAAQRWTVSRCVRVRATPAPIIPACRTSMAHRRCRDRGTPLNSTQRNLIENLSS